MCLFLLAPILRRRRAEKSDNYGPEPHLTANRDVRRGRQGKRYQEDLEKYGPEIAERNYKKRLGTAIAVAAYAPTLPGSGPY